MDIPTLRQGENVKALLNVQYGEDVRQSLDVYMPPGTDEHPVMFFVHGGAWSSGERKDYRSIGYFYAQKGFVTVLVDHRLSPGVAHPTHIKDVAKAFAWTKHHIQDFHGDKNRVCICGHSSGAHLVALLATNQKYLGDEGFDNSEIEGVIAVSGVYSLGANVVVAGLGGVFPSSQDRKEASPINFIDETTPPFLVMYAENEIVTLGSQSISFHKALKSKKIPANLKYIRGHDHYSIITDCATSSISSKNVLDFMRNLF